MECIWKEFVRHEFRFTPAKGKVVNIYRETYKCPECAISEEHPDDQTFVKAPVQEPLIPESYASESVVGWSAIKPAGIGMEAAGCPIEPGYAC